MRNDYDDDLIFDEPIMEGLLHTIGEDALLNLSELMGGRRLYIPAVPGPNSPLVHYLGIDLAKKLADLFGGRSFDIPIRPGRASLIAKLRQQGKTGPEIAEAMKIHLRTVRLHIAKLGDENQLDFFQ